MFNFSKNLSLFFFAPALLVVLSVGVLFVWGLQPGIDLSGGSLLEVRYPAGRPPVATVQEYVQGLGLGEVRVQATGENGYILRQRDLSETERQVLLQPLRNLGRMEEVQFTSVGPSLGSEILHKAWIQISLVVLCIVGFIAFAFRKVSQPVASWKYGVVAVGTLLFDVLLPVAAFAVLGHFIGAEVDTLFIVAVLAILGISINDKIVVFDRIRENLRNNEEVHKHEPFAAVVGKSVRQTLARSINTSLTVVIVLAALYVWGPESTKVFALTLMVGMIVGTYSSIFLASPLLVLWERSSRRKA